MSKAQIEAAVRRAQIAWSNDRAREAEFARCDKISQLVPAADNDVADIDRRIAAWCADETPVDDDYDWDTDGGEIAHAYDHLLPTPPVERPHPPVNLPPPVEEREERPVTLGADGAGEFVRACRAAAGFSQRDLARESGIAAAMIARIESGRCADPRLSTLVRIGHACEVMLVATSDYLGPLLPTDRTQRQRDNGGRFLPAHLMNWPIGGPDEPTWWAEEHYSLHRSRRPPERTYSPGNYLFRRPDD